MSNKREREKRREERVQAESQVETSDRRTRLLQFGAGAVFLAVVAVVVLIVASSSSSDSGGEATNLTGVSEANQLFAGIPQEGLTLGDPKAPVTLYEYGDLQCPVCKQYSEEILPPIYGGMVKEGKAKLVFRNFTIIGPESTPAGAATLAAGEQGRGWNYLEVFYRNQGKENSEYVTDEFMTAIAKAAGVKNIAQWNEDRKSAKVTSEVQETTEQAQKFGFTGTPSFAVEGPSSNGIELLGTPGSTESIEEKIERAS
ncbi:MAG TPA: thioredoxin domain-containing protein [Solirubrobacterales bacterium]|jgi:protein-disulfide isomerase|nr:thioredoxin domain-containing protein [Solirubrobacterales bacterium]